MGLSFMTALCGVTDDVAHNRSRVTKREIGRSMPRQISIKGRPSYAQILIAEGTARGLLTFIISIDKKMVAIGKEN